MKRKFSLTTMFVMVAFCTILKAQTQTITITSGPDWADALVYKNTLSGYSHIEKSNFGNHTMLSAKAWTHSMAPTYFRTLLKFDLRYVKVGFPNGHSEMCYL